MPTMTPAEPRRNGAKSHFSLNNSVTRKSNLILRLGRAIVSPRHSSVFLRNGQRRELLDIIWMLPLWALTIESPRVAMGITRTESEGGGQLVQSILESFAAIWPDYLGFVSGVVLISLGLHCRGRGRSIELAICLSTQAWMVYLSVRVVLTLIAMIFNIRSWIFFERITYIGCLLVWFVHWFIRLCVALDVWTISDEQLGRGWMVLCHAVGSFILLVFVVVSINSLAWPASVWSRLTLKPFSRLQAPDFTVRRADSAEQSQFRLLSQRGHPLLLEFWATWCGPCKESLMVLNQVYIHMKDRGVTVIAIETGNDLESIRRFSNKHGLLMPIWIGGAEISDRYGLRSFPHLVLINSQGRISRIFRGPLYSASEIEAAVNAAGF